MLIYLGILLLLLILLYFNAIMPRVFNRKDFSPYKGRYYAHRGLHSDPDKIPENSLAAFKLAVEHNYGIEMDVQLSKDNIPVIFHDFNLKRICRLNKKVHDLTYEELKKLRLNQSNETIPTLQEVLDTVKGKVPLIIEFKVEYLDTSVCDITAPMLEKYKGSYCIESFNPLVLFWYRRKRPHIIRGQLASNLVKDKEVGSIALFFVLQNLLLNFLTKPDFISFNHKYRKMLSFSLCRHFYRTPSFAWTIRSQKSLEESRGSFDYFIFDHFIPDKNKTA